MDVVVNIVVCCHCHGCCYFVLFCLQFKRERVRERESVVLSIGR